VQANHKGRVSGGLNARIGNSLSLTSQVSADVRRPKDYAAQAGARWEF